MQHWRYGFPASEGRGRGAARNIDGCGERTLAENAARCRRRCRILGKDGRIAPTRQDRYGGATAPGA